MVEVVLAAAQVALALALVVATVVYAWYTKKMANSLYAQLDWNQRPVIAVSLDFIGPVAVNFRFENIGLGLANDIQAKIASEPEGLSFEWAFPALLPRQSATPFMPDNYRDLDSLLKLDRVRIDLSCKDVSGAQRQQNVTLELKPFREKLAKVPTVYEEPLLDYVKKQTEHQERISRTLQDLSAAVRDYLRDNKPLR